MSFLPKLLHDGGPLVYVILAFGALAFLLFLERSLYFLRARVDTEELFHGLMNHLRNNNLKEAIANCDNKTGMVGEVFRNAIERWEDGPEAIHKSAEESIRLNIPKLENNMKLLASISNIAPVIGLLGTLFWMIKIFEKLGQPGGQFVATVALAGEMKGALVCTAAGLIVALAAQLFYFFLLEQIDRITLEMNKAASEICYFLCSNPAQKKDKEGK
ncbi:MAG: MotA/TolQ/ExbB proton channel family protein [Lentisphaeria bacterium]|jgi:biopolymer transport protein ExbB|nr:MotA/TolQ/ExbB proton channel family protein [Lentisphaeria bacterium]MDY0176382.1 MotA/TolQ/ExbB proton channel family protein [Lentisphaeria bacterium]NLZ59982.1 MotA/TolQ/ExbB proton channel family protein [Lentisphaerota bacterium]